MKNHRNSLRLGLLAAGIAASAIATAGNGVPALQAAGAKSKLATIAAESDRLPVVSLTSTMGDVGFEIFDGKTKRVNLASLPKDATDAIVYVDVDSVDLNRKKTQATLNLARDLGWVVLAESSSWDVQRLHAFIATYFPGTSTKGLQNVAVRIGSYKGRSIATDLTPSEAAVEVGIDYLQTSEAKALARNDFSIKAIAPGSNYAWFANNAYQATASNRTLGTRYYTVALNRDVVKVWRSTSNGTTDCIVSWRGSSTAGDWLTNITNQFGGSARVPGESSTNSARIGVGYANRLTNYRSAVNAVSCNNTYRVTGHSLGGAMAEAYAFTIRSKRPNMEAYNPARVGNASFRSQLVSYLGSKVEVFCRNLDPVWTVPIGLEHVGSNNGCTYWGSSVSIINPVANHSMSLWL